MNGPSAHLSQFVASCREAILSHKLYAGFFVLLVSAAVGYLFVQKIRADNDPLNIHQKYLTALLRGDADEVWRITDHHEFENNGMTKADLKRFLDEWLRPKIDRIDSDSDDDLGSGSWGVKTTIGRNPLVTTVEKCDEGLRVVEPLTDIFCTFVGIQDNHSMAKTSEEIMQCWWKNSLRIAPELAKFHFTKIQQSPSSEPISIVDFALHNRDKLVALHTGTSPALLGLSPH